MNTHITDKEAAKTLHQVKGAQEAITRQTAKEYAPWIGWGLWILVFYAAFDFVNPAIWGPITFIASMLGTVITVNYFRKRKRKVHAIKRVPGYAWFLYGGGIFGAVLFADITSAHFAYAWTVAGLAVGLPCILYGLKLKSDA